MELDGRALPLTRRRLDLWLWQETGHSGTEWRLSLFARIDSTVDRDALTLHRLIGIGVITTSNAQYSDRAANGRRRVGSISRSQQANRRCLRDHRVGRG